jgi:hypothetical protein
MPACGKPCLRNSVLCLKKRQPFPRVGRISYRASTCALSFSRATNGAKSRIPKPGRFSERWRNEQAPAGSTTTPGPVVATLSPRPSWSVFTLPTDFCSNGRECVRAAALFRGGGNFPTRRVGARSQSRQFSAATRAYQRALSFRVRRWVVKSQCTIPKRMS